MFKKASITINFNHNGYPEVQFAGKMSEESLRNAAKLLDDYCNMLYPEHPIKTARQIAREKAREPIYEYITIGDESNAV